MQNNLASVLEPLIGAIADAVVARLSGANTGDMVDQRASTLGKRRHCAAVRRRLANGEGGAAIVGRAHLLAPEAVGEEMARLSATHVAHAEAGDPLESYRGAR